MIALGAIFLLGVGPLSRALSSHEEGSYSEDVALKFVSYSQAAFCSKHSIENWSCGSMCENAQVIPGKVRFIPAGATMGVQGFVAETASKRCVVAFRGSLSAKNWYADADFLLRPWPPVERKRQDTSWCRDCYVHTGFATAYEELHPAVVDAMAELQCQRVSVTGHSLGAAVATIAAFDLRARLGVQVDAVWTFGKPRLGNYAFVKAFEAAAERQAVSPSLWRVVHYHDPVPRAPPDVPFLYEVGHEGLEVYYTDRLSTQYLLCPQDGPQGNRSWSCSSGWPLPLCLNGDHVDYLNQTFKYKHFPEECKADGAESLHMVV